MLRRLSIVVAFLLTALPVPFVSAQITSPPTDHAPDGRTPRQPRTPGDDSFNAPPAPPAPAASIAPRRIETGVAPPAPVGVAMSRVRSRVTTDQRAVALTLDDGYDPDPRILGLIESYGIHGTAFIVGAVADSNPWLLNELARLGWLVCSHTYDHTLLPGRSVETIRSEIRRGIEAVERVVGYRCPYFRAPYGSVNASVAAVADEFGLEIIGWETSISDSAPRGTDPDLQLEIATRSLREGSIVLGHFGGTNSYEVLSALLSWLSDEGYRVGSVAELIAGNVEAMTPNRGTAGVSVDVPGLAGQAGAVLPSRPTATRPWSLSTMEIALDMVAIAALLLLVRRRFGPRRHRRKRPKVLADLLILEDTVPEWERTSVDAPSGSPVSVPGALGSPVAYEATPSAVAVLDADAALSVMEMDLAFTAPVPPRAVDPAPSPAPDALSRASVITEGWT